MNGAAVKSGAELRNRIGMLRVGEQVRLALLRDGKPRELTATVQARPESTAAAAQSAPGGATPDDAALHPSLDGLLLADAPGGGALVRGVAPGSPASQSPLREGDVITRVNQRPVANLRELRTVTQDQSSFVLGIRRGTSQLVLPIR